MWSAALVAVHSLTGRRRYCFAFGCAHEVAFIGVRVCCLHINAWEFALPRLRRQDGWTSTPGARRGASA